MVPQRGVCISFHLGETGMLYLDGNADEVAHLTSHMAQMTKQKP